MKFSKYAQKVGVNYRTAYRWFKKGKIRGYQMDTGTIDLFYLFTNPKLVIGKSKI